MNSYYDCLNLTTATKLLIVGFHYSVGVTSTHRGWNSVPYSLKFNPRIVGTLTADKNRGRVKNEVKNGADWC